MSHRFKKGFTLVELIVVITILAVLATVAFISFQGYSTQSRDTKRMTDIATISKGLQVYLAANSNVPEPSETKVLFNTGSVNMIVQGYAGNSVLNTVRVQDAKDPTDETFYTYSTNAAKTKFQLMALLENQGSVSQNNLNTQTYADYSDRYIYVKGQKVGILTSPLTHIPIQELGNDIDISTNLDDFEISFGNNNSATLSGDELYETIVNINITQVPSGNQGNSYYDMGLCNQPDITIGSTTIAACNLGTITAGTSKSDPNGYGHHYQFGRNVSIENGGWNSHISNYDWLSPGGIDEGSANNWGVLNSEKTTATYNTPYNTNLSLLKGPCPTGYHIPTNREWNELINNTTILNEDDAYNILGLTLAGIHSYEDGSLLHSNLVGAYWSSSPDDELGYNLLVMGTNILPSNPYYRATGYSIRCFKN